MQRVRAARRSSRRDQMSRGLCRCGNNAAAEMGIWNDRDRRRWEIHVALSGLRTTSHKSAETSGRGRAETRL